jgi:endonuclease/exonuclease/phosphatase family metal-dependent hydrolase
MELSVITSNISADFLSPPGVPSWDERKHRYTDFLLQASPDIIGLQEATPNQFQFLKTHLLDFSALSVPADNPTQELRTVWKQKYEKFGLPEVPSPYEILLFYRANSLDLLASGHWWLSPTPEVPSIGFGNTAPRVVLWAHLRHKPSAKEFVIFNTHIDHRSPNPMVELCRKSFSAFAAKYSSLIFIGDLNFNEKDRNYELLVHLGINNYAERALPL